MPALIEQAIVCPNCQSKDLSFSVNLFIHAPVKYYLGLSKSALRSKEVTLQGADWLNSRMWCNNCGHSTSDPKEKQHG